MRSVIDYRITHQVEWPDLKVDGVEIVTRKEQEAAQAFAKRLIARMDQDIERAFYGGDPPKLPKS